MSRFFFKQWGGITSKAGGRELDGETWERYPLTESVVAGLGLADPKPEPKQVYPCQASVGR